MDDNLDSWSCALYYDVHKKTEELPNTSMVNTGVKIPRQQAYNGYQYEERYEEEIFSEVKTFLYFGGSRRRLCKVYTI